MSEKVATNSWYEEVIKKGVKLTNQFYIMMTGTDVASIFGSNKFHYYADGANLPGGTLGSAPISFHGIGFEVPTVFNYAHDWTCNVLCDKELALRTGIEEWVAKYSSLSKSGGGNKAVTDNKLIIKLLNSNMEMSDSDNTTDGQKTYTLVGVFPSTYGDMQWSHENPGLQKFSVGFKYQYWYQGTNDPLNATT